jgi:transcription-repair coupling factor (superfamily II helicase)
MVQLPGLLDLLRAHPTYRDLLARLRDQKHGGDLGVLRAARPYVLAVLSRDWNAPVIYITARVDRAYNVSEQLPAWLDDSNPVSRFAEPTPLFYERAPWGETALRNRIEALAALMPPDDSQSTETNPLVVASARAVMQRTMPVHQFRQGQLALETGQRHVMDKLLAQMLQLGYEPESMVIEAGKFSRRGGIIDIYPTVADAPLRIEFFDDEIDSLRHFDPETQRSLDPVKRVLIPPAREVLPAEATGVAAHLQEFFAAQPADDMTSAAADAISLSNGTAFPFLEFYLPYVYPNPISLLDYAPDDALIVIEDWAKLRDTIAGIESAGEKSRAEKIAAGELPADYPLPYLSWEMLNDALAERYTLRLGHSDDSARELDVGASTRTRQAVSLQANGSNFRAIFAPENRFGGQLRPMLTHLRQLRNTGDRAVVVTTQAARLTELWHEQEAAIAQRADDIFEAPERKSLIFVEGALREGWRLRLGDGEFHLLTDAEIFGWNRPEPRRRKSAKRKHTPALRHTDLQDGDFVVHMDYGVGRFAGIRRRTLSGVAREYLVVEYAGTDTLFVPIHQADRLTKYVGADDKPPTLSKLGQQDWIRIKSKARQSVEDEARQLLELYARRASAPGFSFAPDTPWQHELEASFPYVETEDQLKAVRDVKVDMERAHPMDRLICGDVGYGKTEVALRAAFKAVMSGKQVAVLAPTTILAQQHYETFSQRLAAFPVKVEALSRFRAKAEQNRIIPQVSNGEIDVIIGTHRLLSNDVQFKDLGLIVIDEEQRFGVKHKEHFKSLRAQVDVLTLTATPIPRTLYMSLTGVRDISMIHTPPDERLPVITHVGTFDDRLVRAAILRELERGGQVFFVHNRVNSIETARENLEEIVPEARLVVGHGQMDERLLAAVMEQFGRGEFDILVSTSIIESGLDIPTANTLIVDRADWFGLAQLYQIRGRVGRSAQQAYAYFFHPTENRLTGEARVRMDTLAEYTELGSGFQIAIRDLELRGAGDILSMRQTGHVAAIGLHLYTQMLGRAVRELKGKDKSTQEIPPDTISETSIVIDLPLTAYLPTDFVPEMAQRLQIYRRIGGLHQREDVAMMRAELRDRFGLLPDAVEGLLYQIDVKLLAQIAGASAVMSRDNRVEIRLPYLAEVDRQQLNAKLGADVRVTRTAVEIPQTDETWQLRLLDLLEQLAREAANARVETGL